MSPDSSHSDKLYAAGKASPGGFVFDEKVASVFEDMIKRSVPGYGMTLSLMPLIASRFVRPETRVYDLGCSLGAGLLAAHAGLPGDARGCQLIGVDSSPAMLKRCQSQLSQRLANQRLELQCQDARETAIENASLVILNFTLQFIPTGEREALLARIAKGLVPGGVLLLSEKIRFEDPQTESDLFALHHDFKRSQGYSDLEISAKRSALENVLVTETLAAHRARLQDAGFLRSEVWLQCFNFASLLAFKA